MLSQLPYHRARVESFDTLHDLSLALLATVLLPVDSGVSQLLHYLQQTPTIKGFVIDFFHSWHFHLSNTGVTNSINNRSPSARPQYCAHWPTGMDYWHTSPSFILLVTRAFPWYVKMSAVRMSHMEKYSFLLLTSRALVSHRCSLESCLRTPWQGNT